MRGADDRSGDTTPHTGATGEPHDGADAGAASSTKSVRHDRQERKPASNKQHPQGPRPGLRLSLLTRWSALIGTLLTVGILIALALTRLLPGQPGLVLAICLLCVLPLSIITIRAQLEHMLSLFRALTGTVTSYQDGDFSFSLHWPQNDELSDLVAAYNALGAVLREQRLDLVQRELLLDTMVQNTPVAMLLVREAGAVVYANIAARQLLGNGRRLEGHRLDALLEQASPALREALARGGDGLFSSGDGEDEEVFHLARRQFSLNGRQHELLLLRQLTLELRRQEVQTWKKVIRVISHELNNSLAPLTSLAHSGGELVRRGRIVQLVADDADDFFPRLHLLPAQLQRQLAQQQQLVLAAVQAELAARQVEHFLVLAVAAGEQAVAAARQRLAQRRRRVLEQRGEAVALEPAAVVEQ